jgi:hypothetical protein
VVAGIKVVVCSYKTSALFMGIIAQRKKNQFQQWIILAITWQVVALWLSVYDHLVIHSDLANAPAENYSFLSNWFLNSSGTLIATILGGSFLVFYVNTKFADKSNGQVNPINLLPGNWGLLN